MGSVGVASAYESRTQAGLANLSDKGNIMSADAWLGNDNTLLADRPAQSTATDVQESTQPPAQTIVNGWSEGDEEQLRRLVAGGVSYSDIAQRLGRSTGAVCGKANRLGIARRLNHQGNGRSLLRSANRNRVNWSRIRSTQAEMARSSAATEVVSDCKRILAAHAAEAADRKKTNEPLVSIEENSGCCFVVADPATTVDCCCGRPKFGRSVYCREHFERAYTTKEGTR